MVKQLHSEQYCAHSECDEISLKRMHMARTFECEVNIHIR